MPWQRQKVKGGKVGWVERAWTDEERDNYGVGVQVFASLGFPGVARYSRNATKLIRASQGRRWMEEDRRRWPKVLAEMIRLFVEREEKAGRIPHIGLLVKERARFATLAHHSLLRKAGVRAPVQGLEYVPEYEGDDNG